MLILYFRLRDVLSLVKEVYGDIDVLMSKSSAYKKSQHTMQKMMQTMFPEEEFFEEYKHPDIKSPSGTDLILDNFCPSLKLAVEYQGYQHYKLSGYFHRKASLEEGKSSDDIKRELCKENGKINKVFCF